MPGLERESTERERTGEALREGGCRGERDAGCARFVGGVGGERVTVEAAAGAESGREGPVRAWRALRGETSTPLRLYLRSNASGF